MSPTQLTRTCRQHGLADDAVTHVYDPVGGHQRATILRADFVASLAFVDLRDDPDDTARAEKFAAAAAAAASPRGGG